MSDIVERLRVPVQMMDRPAIDAERLEAATEIERLQAELLLCITKKHHNAIVRQKDEELEAARRERDQIAVAYNVEHRLAERWRQLRVMMYHDYQHEMIMARNAAMKEYK